MVAEITVRELQSKLAAKSAVVVDIRDDESFAEGHIPGAFLLTNDNLVKFVKSVDKTKEVVVCCYRGNSSRAAVPVLQAHGLDRVCSLNGGYEAWALANP